MKVLLLLHDLSVTKMKRIAFCRRLAGLHCTFDKISGYDLHRQTGLDTVSSIKARKQDDLDDGSQTSTR